MPLTIKCQKCPHTPQQAGVFEWKNKDPDPANVSARTPINQPSHARPKKLKQQLVATSGRTQHSKTVSLSCRCWFSVESEVYLQDIVQATNLHRRQAEVFDDMHAAVMLLWVLLSLAILLIAFRGCSWPTGYRYTWYLLRRHCSCSLPGIWYASCQFGLATPT